MLFWVITVQKKKEMKERQTYRFQRQTSHHPQGHGPNLNLESEDSPNNSLGHKNTRPVRGKITRRFKCIVLLLMLK